jgi:tetratricopeptide (TPR) repeat protein
MAHWGVAMSGFHQIWDTPDAAGMAAGWREMRAAQAAPAKTDRERGYITALADFFKPGKAAFQARIEAYSTALGALYTQYPDDVDAGAFYALSLLAAQSPSDESLTQEHKALAVLQPLAPRFPDHPGIVHYIIHACDTPTLAMQGLAAARRYSDLAASGPHAVHMPGHIFARLGMWEDDINVNTASVAASHAADEHHLNGWMDQFHSDDFLLYAYLQSGQDDRAKAVVADALANLQHYQSMPDMVSGRFMTDMFASYHLEFPLFYGLEMHDWAAVLKVEPVRGAPARTQTQVYWARAIADGHLHRARHAHQDLAIHDAMVREIKKKDHNYVANSTGARIGRNEMVGWVAFAEGKTAAAVAALRAAADLQDKVGQGEVDIPAREMLADILSESGQHAAALVEYQRALQLSPNRFNGLFGAGSAAEAQGDSSAASRYYAALLKSTDNGAHSTRPQIAHAKEYLGGHPVQEAAPTPRRRKYFFAAR